MSGAVILIYAIQVVQGALNSADEVLLGSSIYCKSAQATAASGKCQAHNVEQNIITTHLR